MKTVTGTLTFINEDKPKSDNIVLSDGSRIYLPKGLGAKYKGNKGDEFTVVVDERAMGDKVFLWSKEKDIEVKVVENKPAPKRNYTKKYQPTQDTGFVDRQESIVFQNAMAHATALSIHNSHGDTIEIEDVIELAKQIARVSLNPELKEKEVTQDTGSSKGVF